MDIHGLPVGMDIGPHSCHGCLRGHARGRLMDKGMDVDLVYPIVIHR
jgi:hypothetical protein